MQVQFAAQSYQARALPLNAQRTVNFYAEQAPPDAKSPVVVYNAPGLKAFSDGLAGAIRGKKVMADVLYAVAGSTLYSVDSAGVATNLGEIDTSVGSVSMAVNRASPPELCIVDGQDGWTYDTSNGLRKITDGDFAAADTVTFQDGYFIFNEAGTSRFFISAIDDGRSYSATDFADAESDPEDIVAVISSQQELWVLKKRSFEVWHNTGNADFPFERMPGGVKPRGLAAAFAIAEDDNTLFWLGDDLIVYRANGYTPLRVSTHAIEEDIRKMSDVSDAYAFFVTIEGHKFFHLTFPTGRKTFVYDVATGLWHERESFGARHWRGATYANAYGKHLVGDAFQGRIGELDLDTFSEFGGVMQGILTGPVAHHDRKQVYHRRLEIEFEAGVGNASVTDPQMWMDYSDDGGRTWSARKPFRALGEIGEYATRVRFLRLGQSRNRIYRLTIADAVKRSIVSAYLDAGPGST
jgi:hypothetical protein